MQVLDDKNVKRRFRASNYQSTTRVKPFICTMPMRLDEGWNQIQFNLSDFTRRAYGTNYIETHRVQVSLYILPVPIAWIDHSHPLNPQIHANCRIRRVYFSDRLYSEDELPAEFKLYLPVQNKSPAKVRTALLCVVAEVKVLCLNTAEIFTGSTSCSGPDLTHTTYILYTQHQPTHYGPQLHKVYV